MKYSFVIAFMLVFTQLYAQNTFYARYKISRAINISIPEKSLAYKLVELYNGYLYKDGSKSVSYRTPIPAEDVKQQNGVDLVMHISNPDTIQSVIYMNWDSSFVKTFFTNYFGRERKINVYLQYYS
ncbi:MAG: hypothetical protein ACK5NK_07240 [Niabella sp.]